VVGRQPKAPAAFTPREIPGTHFQRLSRPQGTWFCRGNHGKNPQWHHYATPGPSCYKIYPTILNAKLLSYNSLRQKHKMDSERNVQAQIQTFCLKLLIEKEWNIIWKRFCFLSIKKKHLTIYKDFIRYFKI